MRAMLCFLLLTVGAVAQELGTEEWTARNREAWAAVAREMPEYLATEEAKKATLEWVRKRDAQAAQSDPALYQDPTKPLQYLRERKAQEKADSPYLTPDEVKVFWAKKLKVPRELEKDYEAKLAQYRGALAEIKNGGRDLEARRAAATYNLALTVKNPDPEMAKVFQAELQSVDQAEAEIAKRRAEERQHQELMDQFSEIGAQLEQANAELETIRAK